MLPPAPHSAAQHSAQIMETTTPHEISHSGVGISYILTLADEGTQCGSLVRLHMTETDYFHFLAQN